MKKLSCMIIVLLVTLAAIAGAETAESMTMLHTFSSANMVDSMTVWDGNVIATDDKGNYVVIDPSASAEPVERSLEELYPDIDGIWFINYDLVQADDGIYMILYGVDDGVVEDTEMQVVVKKLAVNGDMLVEEAEWILDWTTVKAALGSYAYHETVWRPCITNGLLVGNVYPKNGPGYIAVFDLNGNTCELFESDAEVMCLYEDGKVLVSITDYADNESPAEIHAFDPANRTTEHLLSIPREKYYGCAYASYEPACDSMYFVRNSELHIVENMDISTMKSVGAVRTNLNYYSCAATMMNGEMYICSAGAALYSYDTVKLNEFEALLIANFSGSYEAEAAVSQKFTEAHPDIVVTDSYPGRNADCVVDGSVDADICMMKVSSSEYALLYDIGLMQPLDSNSVISESVQSTYPWAQEHLMKDGSVVAVPIMFMPVPNFNYYPMAFDALGLSIDDVPATWMEFLQLLQKFPEIAGDNSEVYAFPAKYTGDDVREMVLTELIQSYMAYLDSLGKPVSFDTEIFLALIAELDKIDFDALVQGDPESFISHGVDDVLFSQGESVSPYAYTHHAIDVNAPLLLAFEDNAQPVIASELHVAFVLPGSDKTELAIEYLQLIAQNNPEIINIQISPEHNDTVISPSFEDDIAFYTEKISGIEAAISEADSDSLSQLESDLDYWRAELSDFEAGLDPFAWEVSFEAIEWYRSLVEYVSIQTSCGLDDSVHSLIIETCAEYLNDAIPAEKLPSKLEDCLCTLILEAE